MKLGKYLRKSQDMYFFWCIACNQVHALNNTWQFNNNLDSPTFNPSVLVSHIDGDSNKKCHLFIINGQLNYLSDSWHGIIGLVDMIPWPDDYPIIGEEP